MEDPDLWRISSKLTPNTIGNPDEITVLKTETLWTDKMRVSQRRVDLIRSFFRIALKQCLFSREGWILSDQILKKKVFRKCLFSRERWILSDHFFTKFIKFCLIDRTLYILSDAFWLKCYFLLQKCLFDRTVYFLPDGFFFWPNPGVYSVEITRSLKYKIIHLSTK